MYRPALTLLPLLLLAAPAWSQSPSEAPSPYTLRAQSNVVLLPTQVETKKGEILYGLNAKQFVIEDNGVPQTVQLDEDTDILGLSLVVVVQCSRSAVMEYTKIQGLATMVEAIAGDAPREVALVSYGAEPELLGNFSRNSDRFRLAMNDLQPCDDSAAATLDAVSYATRLLQERNNHYRHAILLLSEARDHGSKANASQVIAELGSSNTVVDAVTFSPGRNQIVDALKYGGGPGPMGLLVMAVNAVKKNAAKELAALSGGEYLNFTSQKSFENNLHQLSNHIHNYYLLSFQPHTTEDTSPGLHSLRVRIPDYPDARIRTRESYWSGAVGFQTDPAQTP